MNVVLTPKQYPALLVKVRILVAADHDGEEKRREYCFKYRRPVATC